MSRDGVSSDADRAGRFGLSLLALAWGMQAIVTQALLLREALVLMLGTELAWGLVLFAWLLGVAIGAGIGGRLAQSGIGKRHAALALVLVLIALSAGACAELWVFRGARLWLGVQPGEFLPLSKTVLAAVLFVSPISALIGLAFPLASCVTAVRVGGEADAASDGPTGEPCLSFGHVYALESAGSLIGGALFTFWAVEHLSPIQTVLVCAAITTAASGAMVLARRSRRAATDRRARGVLGLALIVGGVAAVSVSVLAGDGLNRWLVDRRWRNTAPGYEQLAEAESKYQNLAIGRRAGQYTLYCDGQVSADFPDPYTYAPLAHFWMCEHPSPRSVLVLGGGAEGLLSEMLLHPVDHIDYVETDPREIALLEPYLAEADRTALNDPRVSVHHVDARYFVKTHRDRFDLVIARFPEPTSALRARLYTDEFYGELRRAMTARSVLCMTAAAAPGELSPASRAYLASIRATLRRHFPTVVIGWGNPAQVLAATADGLISTDAAVLAKRYADRGVASAIFRPVWFEGATDWLDADKLAQREADLDKAVGVQISTDLQPVVYLQRLVLWEAASAGGVGPGRSTGGAIRWLQSIRLAHLSAALVGLGAIALIVSRVRRGTPHGWAIGAVTLSVGSTGLVTMALSIIYLFAFQNLYGYVYQRIGWIIALFMAGLVIGCLLAQRLVRATDRQSGAWRFLIAVDLMLALLSAAVPFVLPALGAMQSSPATFALVEWSLSIMVVLTGVLGGAAFPLAGLVQRQMRGSVARAAGSVIGADHAGACVGALLCGVLLVPVFGTVAAALLLAGMKLTSAGVLATVRRRVPLA